MLRAPVSPAADLLSFAPARPGSSDRKGNHTMISRLLAFAISLILVAPGARAADPAASSASIPPTAAQRYGSWGVDLAVMDRSVKTGDDFFRFVNGKWVATTKIPPDKSSYGAFAILTDLSEARERALLDRWAPDKYALYLSQSGLGLADREFYLRDNFKPQKERYQKYVADVLRLIGWDEPDKNGADIVALETKIADAHWTRAESRNRDKTYNPATLPELEKNAPGFPWRRYFQEAELGKADRAVVRQNTAFPKLAAIFSETPVETLKAWEAFDVADEAAPLLSKRFVDTHWEFRSKFLNGAEEQRPRWKRGVDAAENGMGEAIGRTYVAEYFPPESKAKMEKLVADLLAAMKGRIENLQWMGPETKARALEKLSKFGVKIGYPTKWRDYSTLVIREGDLVGNAIRSAKFEWDRDVNRIGKPIDRLEWGMTPQTVNAYYTPVKNEIVFPAAILQPPFFDPNADPAVNYGGIGAVIGHEITHGFDDQGRKSDGNGMLRDWWTAEDAAKFEAQATKLGTQYEAYNFPQLPGQHIIAKTTMGENIGDL